MPSSRTKAAVVAVAVAALAASAGAASASNRKLLQRPDEGELLGAGALLALDLDTFSDIGGGILSADTLGFVVSPLAAALDAPLGYVMEPVYQFFGNNVPGFEGCL